MNEYQKVKLNKLQKEIKKKHLKVSKRGPYVHGYSWTCDLSIDNQQFRITPQFATRGMPDWYSNMMAIALSKLVEHYTLGKVI